MLSKPLVDAFLAVGVGTPGNHPPYQVVRGIILPFLEHDCHHMAVLAARIQVFFPPARLITVDLCRRQMA